MTVRSLNSLFMPNAKRRSMAYPRVGGHIIGGYPSANPLTPAPIFQLGESSNLALQIGLGLATFIRNSESMYIDHEGVGRTVPNNCALRKGARYVINQIEGPEDFGDAAWLYLRNAAEVSADTVSFTEAASNDWGSYDSVYQDCSESDLTAGTIFLLSAYLSGEGTISIRAAVASGTDPSGYLRERQIVLTETPTRYVVGVQLTTDGPGWGPTAYISRFMADTAEEVTATKWQWEKVTGQSNQNPGEYVSVGVPTGDEELTNHSFDNLSEGWGQGTGWGFIPGAAFHSGASSGQLVQLGVVRAGATYILETEVSNYAGPGNASFNVGDQTTAPFGSNGVHKFVLTSTVDGNLTLVAGANFNAEILYISLRSADHGMGADGIKAFDTLNGNTVDVNGVVTEAPGAAISPAPVWEHQPGSTNKCENYNIAPTDLTGITLNQSGTGATCTVVNDAEVLAALPDGNGKVYALDTTAATAWAWVTINGTVGNLNPHTLSVWAKLISGSAVLKLQGAAQSTSITKQEWTRVLSPNVVPDTTGRRLIINANGTTTRVLFIANQLEEKPCVTRLIPVAGTAVSRAQPEWRYQAAGNIFADLGTAIVAGWVPGFDKEMVPGAFNRFLSCQNPNPIFYQSTEGILTAWDGTGVATKTFLEMLQGDEYDLGVRWSAELSEFGTAWKDITNELDWAWPTTWAIFDGDMVLDEFLYLFNGFPLPFTFGDVRIYNYDFKVGTGAP